jgi:hypothetical protein
MAAIAVDLNHFGGKDRVLPMLQFFIPPLTRETNDDGAPEEVRNLSQEVAELIKGNCLLLFKTFARSGYICIFFFYLFFYFAFNY